MTREVFHQPPILSGPRPPLVPAVAREMALAAGARVAILVEGWSDQAAAEKCRGAIFGAIDKLVGDEKFAGSKFFF